MRLTRVFFNTFMGYGFEGLRTLAKDARAKLGPDTTVLFLNRKMTSFKIVIDDSYIVYFKNGNRRIPLDALQYLPRKFGGSDLEIKEAIRSSLTKKLGIATDAGNTEETQPT